MAGESPANLSRTIGDEMPFVPFVLSQLDILADPAVAEGVMTAEVLPFAVAYHSSQLAL